MLNRSSTALADAVLAYMEFLSDEDDEPPIVYPYHNGREHGWAVTLGVGPRLVTFSEDSFSNRIVLYTGSPLDFDSDYSPGGRAYAQRRLFPTNGAYDAAGAALEFLTDTEGVKHGHS